VKAHHIRQSIVDLCQDLSVRGFLAATGGNVALRIDSDHMAVTPSAIDYFALKAENICVLRMADLHQIDGSHAPSVESDLHRRVFRKRPDCHCSLHTHQPAASACALLGNAMPVAPGPRRELLGEMAVLVGYAPSGTRWLASKISSSIRPNVQAYLMRNHGALCCGPDIPTTAATLAALEEEAESYLRKLIESRVSRQPSMSRSLGDILSALADEALTNQFLCTEP
jgi:L-fuculose-phosphate aldolase